MIKPYRFFLINTLISRTLFILNDHHCKMCDLSIYVQLHRIKDFFFFHNIMIGLNNEPVAVEARPIDVSKRKERFIMACFKGKLLAIEKATMCGSRNIFRQVTSFHWIWMYREGRYFFFLKWFRIFFLSFDYFRHFKMIDESSKIPGHN